MDKLQYFVQLKSRTGSSGKRFIKQYLFCSRQVEFLQVVYAMCSKCAIFIGKVQTFFPLYYLSKRRNKLLVAVEYTNFTF